MGLCGPYVHFDDPYVATPTLIFLPELCKLSGLPSFSEQTTKTPHNPN